MRQPAARVKPRIAKTASFPAPIGGWIKNVNLSVPDARRPDGSKVNGAAMLENWFPTATSVRMRGGSARYATIGDGSLPVTSLFSYMNGNNQKLFGTTENALYDITTITVTDNLYLVTDTDDFIVNEDDLVIYIEGTEATVSSLTGGNWVSVQFATPGGTFLRAVNGADESLVYDGSVWGTTPALTGVDSATLSFVWAFKNRLFFIQKDSLDAYYLPVDNIGGALVKFPLGGVFTRGGSLMFGASWSLIEGGDGLTASCVFVTTEGEVAVYKGDDPATAATWALSGVYRIGKPRGPKSFIRAGGDLVIATDVGFVPLSQAVQKDIAALSPNAVSYPIEVAWNEAIADRSGSDWHCEIWPTKQMVLVALPTGSSNAPQMFVANARTGAWSLFTGWDGTCLATFGDRLFFGSSDGRIIEAEVTGADEGTTYVSSVVPLFDPLKSPASLKTGLLARATVRSPGPVEVQLSLQHDFNISLPPAPDDISVGGGSVWGSGIWGQSVWGSSTTKMTYQDWKPVPGGGYALSPAVQITSGSLSPPDVELVQTDMTFDVGDVVT